MRWQNILRAPLIFLLVVGTALGRASAQGPAPAAATPATAPSPAKTTVAKGPRKESDTKSSGGSGALTGLVMGGMTGILFGGLVGAYATSFDNFGCEGDSECESNDSNGEAAGFVVGGLALGAVVGLVIGLAVDGNDADETHPPANKRGRKQGTEARLSPILAVTPNGAIAGMGGTF